MARKTRQDKRSSLLCPVIVWQRKKVFWLSPCKCKIFICFKIVDLPEIKCHIRFREPLLKWKAQYSWPPCTNWFRSIAFEIAKIIYFFYEISYLNEEVNHSEPSVSVSVPVRKFLSFLKVTFSKKQGRALKALFIYLYLLPVKYLEVSKVKVA